MPSGIKKTSRSQNLVLKVVDGLWYSACFGIQLPMLNPQDQEKKWGGKEGEWKEDKRVTLVFKDDLFELPIR